MATPTLVLIPGDGIGQEVVPEAARVLQAVLPTLQIVESEAGWATFQRHGVSVPAATLETINRPRGRWQAIAAQF